VTEESENCTMKSFMFCTHKYSEEMGRACHTWRRKEMHIRFLYENTKERDCLENPGTDGRIICKWILKKQNGREWTRLIYLMTGTSDRLL